MSDCTNINCGEIRITELEADNKRLREAAQDAARYLHGLGYLSDGEGVAVPKRVMDNLAAALLKE
jgi:hypothetical protein